MSNDCFFKNQIDIIIKKAKNLISWILQTFILRKTHTMITLYKSLVIPILWNTVQCYGAPVLLDLFKD